MMKNFPKKFMIIDRTNVDLSGKISYPFIFDDALSKIAGEEQFALLHIWRHKRALVIGPRDSRLGNVERAIKDFRSKGYDVMVRNSGGAAVPLDNGVVNLSILLPSFGLHKRTEDFDLMFDVIKTTLRNLPFEITKGEIYGSYCPGSFDISIEGKKFCGIAQRRQLKATMIQAFLNIEGNGKERSDLIKDFYTLAIDEGDTNKVPLLTENKVTSIKEQYKMYAVSQFIGDLKRFLIELGGEEVSIEWMESNYAKEIAIMEKEFRQKYDIL